MFVSRTLLRAFEPPKPAPNALYQGTSKQAAEKLCSLKGTGFSPYINDRKLVRL